MATLRGIQAALGVLWWCPGPDLNRHDLNGREILSSLDCGTTQDNPPKHKSNALPSCVKLLLDAVILTYGCQQSVSEIHPRGGGLTAVVIMMVTAQIH